MLPRPNILYVFSGERAQGAEIVIERLMDHNSSQVNTHLMLAPGEWAAKLVASKKSFNIVCVNYLKKLNRMHSSALSYYYRAIKNYFAISLAVYHYIKAHQIDLVHANTIVPSAYLLPLVWWSRVTGKRTKFIWSDHDMRYFSKMEGYLSKLIVRSYHHTLAVSGAVAKKYTNNKVTVCYNGLDSSIFRPDASARSSFRQKIGADESFLIGMAANVCTGKGQLSLIRAFQKVLQLQPQCKLVLAGNYGHDEKYNDQFRQEIANHEQLIFLGPIADMPAFYNACELVVNNSDSRRSEALGTSIYEAMACEKIVLAAATGGTPEIISDAHDGFLFEPENEEALVAKMATLIATFDLVGPVAKSARTKVMEHFEISIMAGTYNRLLNELLEKEHRHG